MRRTCQSSSPPLGSRPPAPNRILPGVVTGLGQRRSGTPGSCRRRRADEKVRGAWSETASRHSPVQQPDRRCGVERCSRLSSGSRTCGLRHVDQQDLVILADDDRAVPCHEGTLSERDGARDAELSRARWKHSPISDLLASSFTDSTMTVLPYVTERIQVSFHSVLAGGANAGGAGEERLLGLRAAVICAVSTASYPGCEVVTVRRLIRTARSWWTRSRRGPPQPAVTTAIRRNTLTRRTTASSNTRSLCPRYRHRLTRGSSVPGRAGACRCNEYRSG